MLSNVLVSGLLVGGAAALQIPDNVKTFLNGLNQSGQCNRKLASGFYNSAFEGPDMSYCGDHLDDYGIIYLQGPGKLANMDVDCDGAQGGPQDDGRCDGSSTTIPATAIKDVVAGYNVGIDDLNPHEHSFIVFGNSGTKPDWAVFDPQTQGVRKASITAIICGDKMFYGVWGDSNGDHGPRPSVGEASLALATACFGEGMSGGNENNSSHNEPDVLYIAFTGQDAVPGAAGAAWAAGNFDDFHASLVGLGDKLIKRIGGGKEPGDGDDNSCSWPGHCEGAACTIAQDCADALTCVNGKCA